MCALEIRPLDPFDEAQLRQWYDVYRASETDGREFHTAFAFEEVAATFRSRESAVENHPLLAVADGQVVGVAGCRLSHHENRHLAQIAVGTQPSHQRRGVGTALLLEAEAIARRAGRTGAVADVCYPFDGPRDGAGSAGVEFATRHGYALGLANVQRVLDLPVPDEILSGLAARAQRCHPGYTFRQVTSPVPDDVAVALAELRGAVETEAPTGDIERERGEVDLAALREDEETLRAMGRVRHATVAFAPDGSPAGYTEYVVPEHDRPWVFQWGTLVWREHRGHALGVALKVRNTAWVQQLHPDRAGVRTWNADVNDHMIAVNDAMGFRPVERLGEFHKRLS